MTKNRALAALFCCIFMNGCVVKARIDYINAYKAWRANNFEEAIMLYQKVAESNPRSRYAALSRFNMGNIYNMNLQRYELAVIEYQKAIVLAGFKGPYAYLSQKGIAEIYKGEFKNYERAIFEYKELFKYEESGRDTEEILEEIYQCYLSLKLYEDAEKEFLAYAGKTAISETEKNRIYVMIGNFNKLRGNWRSAVEYYGKAARDPVQEKNAKFLIAEIYFEKKMYKEALEIYRMLYEAEYNRDVVQEKIKFLEEKELIK